jgi:hypothetical protein
MKKTTKILFVFFGVLVVWWLSIFLRHKENTLENYLYSLAYGMIPLVWGFLGIYISKFWGRFQSVMGKSVFFLSLGLVSWSIGNLIFAYYNIILNVEVPYPSIADYVFVLSFPLWVIGMVHLSKASGMLFSLRRLKGRALLFFIPVAIAFLSYYLLFVVARGGEIDVNGGLEKLIFDIAFPVGDVLVLSFCLLLYGLSSAYLGGRYKLSIVMTLLGFVFAYITDFSYSYTTTTGAFFVGNWVDLLYTCTFFLLALGVTSFDPRISDEERLIPEKR